MVSLKCATVRVKIPSQGEPDVAPHPFDGQPLEGAEVERTREAWEELLALLRSEKLD